MNKLFLLGFIFISTMVFAGACSIDVVLVNQDPYPAMPGEYVKVVFQVSGFESPDCGSVEFWINEKYPFSLNPGAENKVVMKSGTYLKDYQSHFLVPYDLRVDKDAIDGDNPIKVYYSFLTGGAQIFSKDFDINVEDSRTDFEVFISDYDFTTKEVTVDILNTGDNNVEGLTIEVPVQEGVKVIGTDKIILGDLNSNEDDSATFKAEMNEGTVNLNLVYTDQIGVRRTMPETIEFNPSLFHSLEKQEKSFSPTLAFIIGLIIPILFMYIRKKIRARRERIMKKKGMAKF